MTTPHEAASSASSIFVGAAPEAARLDRLRAVGEGLVPRRGPPSANERFVAIVEGGEYAAAAWLALGEESSLATDVGVAPRHLRATDVIEELIVARRDADTLALALYGAAAAARTTGRATVAATFDGELAELGGLAAIAGVDGLRAQRVDLVGHRSFAAAGPRAKETMRATFVPQLVGMLERWLRGFFSTAWFRAIDEGTLTREQYAYTLANQHQYVRYTTRHIAGAVAAADDRALRNHWRHHLEGEVDHEKIIEKDLANLGFDVDFVVSSMIAQPATLQFCLAQEAIVGFRRNPVLFLAPPFVAEGFSAHLDRVFIEKLERVAASWGIEVPRHVTSFISSHIAYDGGDDGHWAGTLALLGQYLRTERDLQEFAAVVQLAMDSFQRSYDAFVDDLAIFQARLPQ